MAKFKFPFESLKKYRENRLLTARKEMVLVQTQINALTQRQEESKQWRGNILETSKNISFDPMQLGYMNLIGHESLRVRQLEEKILALNEELERHRSWVTHLGRELKIIEKLEEKKAAEFTEQEKLKEKRFIDGWVAERWSHTKVSKSEGVSE